MLCGCGCICGCGCGCAYGKGFDWFCDPILRVYLHVSVSTSFSHQQFIARFVCFIKEAFPDTTLNVSCALSQELNPTRQLPPLPLPLQLRQRQQRGCVWQRRSRWKTFTSACPMSTLGKCPVFGPHPPPLFCTNNHHQVVQSFSHRIQIRKVSTLTPFNLHPQRPTQNLKHQIQIREAPTLTSNLKPSTLNIGFKFEKAQTLNPKP